MNLQKTVAKKGRPEVLAPGKWLMQNGEWITTGCHWLFRSRSTQCHLPGRCMDTVSHFDRLVFPFYVQVNYFYHSQQQESRQFAESSYLWTSLLSAFCAFGLTEGTASSPTDSERCSVCYQGFTLRSNYCSSYCWQEWHRGDLYVY